MLKVAAEILFILVVTISPAIGVIVALLMLYVALIVVVFHLIKAIVELVEKLAMPTITKAELINMANSPDPNKRKQALELFRAWVKAAPNLQFQDQLNATERLILTRIFVSHKMIEPVRR